MVLMQRATVDDLQVRGAVDAVAVYFLEYQPHYSPAAMALSLIDGPSGPLHEIW